MKWVQLGHTAVSFFFVLSGYILAVAYLRKSPVVDKRRFWTARFARVWPLLAATVVFDTPDLLTYRIKKIGLGTAVLKTAVPLIGSLLMLQAWSGSLRGINNPSWLLSAEAFFYLMFPFIATPLWRLSAKWAVVVAIVVYVSNTVVVTAIERAGVAADKFIFLPIVHLAGFVCGILLARIHFQIMQSDLAASRLKRVAIPLLITSLVIYFGALAIHERYLYPGVMNVELLTPAFAGIILALASGSIVGSFLSFKWMVVLGEASYGLYLIHVPVLKILFRHGWLNTLPNYLLGLAGLFGLSVLSFTSLKRRYAAGS